MRRKWNSESGLTLVEMLAATVILILLGLLLNTGLQMVMNTYRAIVAQSEVELLLSTAVDALADDLRFARDVSGSGGSFTYLSDSFGAGTGLTLDAGRIMAQNEDGESLRVLPTGAYGLNGAYKIKEMTIEPAGLDDPDKEITFTIRLTVTTTDETISAATPAGGVTVRCLNPK